MRPADLAPVPLSGRDDQSNWSSDVVDETGVPLGTVGEVESLGFIGFFRRCCSIWNTACDPAVREQVK